MRSHLSPVQRAAPESGRAWFRDHGPIVNHSSRSWASQAANNPSVTDLPTAMTISFPYRVSATHDGRSGIIEVQRWYQPDDRA